MDLSDQVSVLLRPMLLGAALLVALSGCADSAPACPFTGTGHSAASAGCFLASSEGLLVVQAMNGKLSPPGGSSVPGEWAQCTAFRETLEETGLRLQPRELLRIFETGFHLYRCERDGQSGEIDPPLYWEVRAAFYLPVDQFDDYEWRFPNQQLVLKTLLPKVIIDTPD